MRDEDRAAMSKIGEVLEDLRRRRKNPCREQQKYVQAFEVSSVTAMERTSVRRSWRGSRSSRTNDDGSTSS
jgi:hypothetical protein